MTHYSELPGFNPGAIKDEVDVRDLQFHEVAASLPPFDWTVPYDVEKEIAVALGSANFAMPPEDQGSSSSCGGQSWRYQGEALGAIYQKKFERKSAKFIYAQTFVTGGGSAGRSNADIFVNQGICSELVLPSYINGGAPSEIFMERRSDVTDAARNNAKHDMALAYANVATNIDSIAQAMKFNHGVIIGVVGANNGTWLSANPQVPHAGQALWNHWLFAGKARMMNGVKQIGVLNSWGADVGENGWQWLSESYFSTPLQSENGSTPVWSAWTHTYNPNPPVAFQHTFNTDMAYGLMANDEVKALQTALHLDGDLSLGIPAYGNYLENTRQAVLRFQMKYGINAPALAGKVVGPKTRAQLNTLFA